VIYFKQRTVPIFLPYLFKDDDLELLERRINKKEKISVTKTGSVALAQGTKLTVN